MSVRAQRVHGRRRGLLIWRAVVSIVGPMEKPGEVSWLRDGGGPWNCHKHPGI